MASENETIADIIAEVRRNAESSQMGHKSFIAPRAEYWRRLAARLEAAWRRERESLLPKQRENVNSGSAVYTGDNKGGNAAAMREALHALKEKFRDIDLARDSIEKEIYELADAALSNQPRNCDIYPTNEDAWRSYQLSHAKNADAYVEATVPDFIDWLFAPADKGATDEQK